MHLNILKLEHWSVSFCYTDFTHAWVFGHGQRGLSRPGGEGGGGRSPKRWVFSRLGSAGDVSSPAEMHFWQLIAWDNTGSPCYLNFISKAGAYLRPVNKLFQLWKIGTFWQILKNLGLMQICAPWLPMHVYTVLSVKVCRSTCCYLQPSVCIAVRYSVPVSWRINAYSCGNLYFVTCCIIILPESSSVVGLHDMVMIVLGS